MAITLTTLARVRSEAGFTNNANINDTSDIAPHAEHADGEVLILVGQRYTLPLSENTYWADSPARYMLEGITTNYAAGLLMLKVYEGQGGAMTELAKEKISRAKEHFDLLLKGGIILLGNDGIELRKNSEIASGLPSTNENDEKAKVSINNVF